MTKAHKRHERAERKRVREWIEDNYHFVNRIKTDEESNKEVWIAKHREASNEYKAFKSRYTLPFLLYEGDGIILDVPMSQQPSGERDVTQQYQRRLEQSRIRREREPGIPATVDILQWYAAYLKIDDMRHPEKQEPMKKDGKVDHYREIIIDLYIISGFSIGDSVERAYSSQGEELMRYLSDDKRHPLNRNRDGDDMEFEQIA